MYKQHHNQGRAGAAGGGDGDSVCMDVSTEVKTAKRSLKCRNKEEK